MENLKKYRLEEGYRKFCSKHGDNLYYLFTLFIQNTNIKNNGVNYNKFCSFVYANNV